MSFSLSNYVSKAKESVDKSQRTYCLPTIRKDVLLKLKEVAEKAGGSVNEAQIHEFARDMHKGKYFKGVCGTLEDEEIDKLLDMAKHEPISVEMLNHEIVKRL